MRRMKSVLAVCGLAAAAVAIGSLNPKAVRAAVAAAMVQVTNTASNPVVTQSVGNQAANLVEVFCGGAGTCFQVLPGGGPQGAPEPEAYVVPAGKTLVITDLDLFSDKTDGSEYSFQLGSTEPGACPFSDCLFALSYALKADGVTHHFSLGRGIAWPSGAQVAAALGGGPEVHLYGYLTTN